MGDLREEIAKSNARFGEYVRKGDVAGLILARISI